MPHCPAVGVGHILTASARFTLCLLPGFCCVLFIFSVHASAAVGVAHNKQPVPPVRRADGTSRNNKWLDGVSDSFDVLQDTAEQQPLLLLSLIHI